MLASGADPNVLSADGKYTPLIFVADLSMSESYRAEMLADLLAAGACANKPSAGGDLPLHAAVRRGDRHLARRLLQAGADIHATDGTGQTALHIATACAAGNGRTEMLDFLLRAGANSLLQNGAGQTALDRAGALRARTVFGDVPLRHLQAWEKQKDTLRARFEDIHARRGPDAVQAARDRRVLAARAGPSLSLRPK